ncbi:DUF488 family protein [Xanthomonas vesicatoria]|uniref:DUF488 domain-containing protein n=1 Tax=Xanthomonas vesicatoria TaxID=56460 RepID=UPI001E3F9F3B|nr:DUF488 domain-containing protein [Xanthomonas vesicatoria]MCC8616825.1 DUF488 domain-containing protein [Xanthomonas vesicatoria]MCC8630619.1 DUF488 domain-containing protein [Xanthomonas vesicatoria]
MHDKTATAIADMAAPRDADDAIETVWTIGHSTKSWETFVALLKAHGIQALVDVRRFPGSRRYPWFASDTMAQALQVESVRYVWLPQLGGRRKAQPGSPNGGWRNAGFQGYADHMTSAEFEDGLAQVLALARVQRTTLMCAEAMWWQCHRRLIADLLLHRGCRVLHVLSEKPAQPHQLNPDARAVGRDLIYPPLQAGLFCAD